MEVAGDSEFHTLSSLQSDTEYIVTIIPLYEGNTEGPVATARFKIGRCGYTVHQNITVSLCGCFSHSYTRMHQNSYLLQYT